MKLLLAACVVLAGGAGACIEHQLVECNDGRVCPGGTICDTENATCIDPLGVTAAAGDIDFSGVECGDSRELRVPLRNYGVSPIEFTAYATVSGVSVSPARATIDPGGSVELLLTGAPGETLPGVMQGSLVVETTYQIVERTLRMTSLGGLITVDATVDFGETQVARDVVRPMTLRNRGNVAVDAMLTLPAPFSASGAGMLRLEAASERTLDVSFDAASIGDYSGTAMLSYDGSVCQPPPTTVTLTGAASGEPILASNTLLDFGATGCVPVGAPRVLTLSSNLPAPQTLTAVIGGNNVADYAVQPMAMLTANGMTTIDVLRNPIPITTAVGTKQASLTVTASPSGAVKTIQLQHLVSAPVLTVSSNFHDFGTLGTFVVDEVSLVLANSGNLAAEVRPAIKNPHKSVLIVEPSPIIINAGMSAQVTVRLKTDGIAESLNGMSIVFEAAHQCSSPPKIELTGVVQK